MSVQSGEIQSIGAETSHGEEASQGDATKITNGSAQVDLQALVQAVTDSGTELTGAKFGAFFYNAVNTEGESYLLYTLSGAPRGAFEKFGLPRNTPLFQPTFRGTEVVRIDDVLKDPRYGHNPPHYGMPKGHLPVCSYLAVPVIARSGEVSGGLFFGHPDPDVFTPHAERVAVSIAALAAMAIENARLFESEQRQRVGVEAALHAQKELEQKLRESEERVRLLNIDLEKRVAERTAELLSSIAQREKLQEQLFQAQKMESIGTLASGIAHDFNNILNLILSYASLLRRNPANPVKLLESVEVINDTVRRGAALVQQLLAIGRKSAVKFEKVDINTAIKSLETLVKETFPKTITVSFVLDKTIPFILADANQIDQVLLNLCVNARDAMPKGGEIKLASRTINGSKLRRQFPDASETQYVWVSVADNGVGMDESTRSRIFEPFFTTKEAGQGSGLGLSVVYGIISNHGGFISVESQLGRGTTFHIYLPTAESAAAFTDRQQYPDDSETRELTGAGETILLVEDETRQLRVMKEVLEAEGYKVREASDGAQAVEMYLRYRNEIALVVLDLGLPKLNGWDAFQTIRREDAKLPMIIATGYLSPEIKSQMAESGVSGVLMKPYQLEDALVRIRQAIRWNNRQVDKDEAHA